MWLNYSDKEVESFHPVCEIILTKALESLNLLDSYTVEHHRTVGSLEMDFVISNIRTSKILCVVEVKRTVEAVLSTRYQLQAMGYVQELRPTEKEKEYYILTNLEAVALFKFSSSRTNVIDQLLSPGIITVRKFSDLPKEEYIDVLSMYFAKLIERVINDDANYFKSFRHFIGEVSDGRDQIISDEKLWHSKFAALAYEYIRGSLSSSGRNQLTDIRRLRSDINKICCEALRINFKGIYGLGNQDYSPLPQIPSDTLNELYKLGSSYIDADAICDILFNLIAKCSTYPGTVPTDTELAKALAVIATAFCNTLQADESIMDPAAGSGNLLSVMPTFFPSITPKQIKANDINEYLLQLLSLRLGLKFPRTISNSDSPSISAYNIADIPKSLFENVKIIVLNPPYLSHTSNASNDYKSGIINRILSIKGSEATTNSLKSSLQSAFVELVTLLDFSSFSNYRFKYLFIDEVQDCDKKQVELIKSIFADTKIIVQRFGDYCQAIFDGEDNDRVEIEELKGDRVSYIHDSNRFGETIAKPLRTLCMEDNRSLVGNDSVPSLKPIIITYVDPLAVIPKFVELLNSITITKKGKLTVLEVANKERYEDPLHRINIKACGWVGKKVSNERARSVVSYFPAFERKDLRPKSEGDYFDDFIPKNPNTNVKDFAASLIQGILKFLDICNIKDGNRRYTRKSLLQVLTSCHLKDVFLNKIMCWSMDLVKSKTPIDITTVKNQIYAFVNNSIMPIFEKNVVEDAKSFFITFGEDNKDVEIIKHGNVFHGEGIDIEVATVHSVKGETHAATLYLETSYFGKHESEYIREQFKGIPYTGTDKRVLQCLRIIYVGASRPRYLLCMAMQKDRFDSIDCPAMRDIWEVVEA